MMSLDTSTAAVPARRRRQSHSGNILSPIALAPGKSPRLAVSDAPPRPKSTPAHDRPHQRRRRLHDDRGRLAKNVSEAAPRDRVESARGWPCPPDAVPQQQDADGHRAANEGPAVRLHIGLEDTRDLIADLEAGLARFAPAAA